MSNVPRLLPALLIFALSLSAVQSQAEAAQDYCQFGTRTIAIFIDRTTAYDDVDKEIFTDGIEKIVNSFRLGDRVLVYTIGGDFAQSAKTFDQCMPGCPEGRGLRDWVEQRCRGMEARADLTRFKIGLAQHIRRMLDDIQQYPYSDIARTIARVTDTLQVPSVSGKNSAPLKTVFVFSDLIENSKVLPWPAIETGQPPVRLEALRRAGITPKLAGADVFAFGMGRLHDPKRSALGATLEQKVKAFWHAYFTSGGATRIYIGVRLP